MHKLTRALFLVMVSSMVSLVAQSHDKVSVNGGGTFANDNALSGGYNVGVNKFNIHAERDSIQKGRIKVSSFIAGPIDPVTGIDFEANATVDAVRVFADHPDVVWVHGYAAGSISFGTSPGYGPLAGTTHIFTPTDGEFIGAISSFGRTNFLSVFENGGPLPLFFAATEDQLTATVGGFSRTLLTNGAEPGKVCIETHGGNVSIP